VRDLPGGPGAPFPYCDFVRPVFAELMSERQAAVAASSSARLPGAGSGQAAAGGADYALFDCI
jgi:hypothetical protein